MSDLVKRLREWWEYDTGHLVSESIARIEKIERELDQWRVNYGNLGLELSAERALADRLWKRVKHAPRCDKMDGMTFSRECTCGFEDDAIAYRKARGL